MTARREKSLNQRRIIKVQDGTGVEVIHTSFEIGTETWKDFTKQCIDKYGTTHKKSYIIRVLMEAWIHGLVDLEELDKKLVTIAKKGDREMFL